MSENLKRIKPIKKTTPINKKVKKSGKGKVIKRFLLGFSSIFIFGFLMVAFVFYGPYHQLRDIWISTAMNTMTHQYLATWMFNDKTIAEVLSHNTLEELNDNTDSNLIDKDTSQRDKDKRIEVKQVKGKNYKGYLMKIYNPKRVSLALAEDFGKCGEQVRDIIKDNDGIAGINASGFLDVNGVGNGGRPDGIIVSNYEVKFIDKNHVHSIIGFDSKNNLVLARYTSQQIVEKKIKEAVEFGPFLIVNGKSAIPKGTSSGINPRTVIGQTKEGAILFLVIDGRQASSIGATFIDLINIMEENGAINAANLDGGASAIMVYNDKILNNPWSMTGGRYVPAAFIVK